MLSESNYPNDIRIKQEAGLLISKGYNVSVIAIKNPAQAYFEDIEGVKVYRVPKIELFKIGKHLKSSKISIYLKVLTILKAIIGYGFEYAYFTIACCFLSTIIVPSKKIDVIHTHNPPDTLFIIALFYKLFFGKKFVYDHHDLSPDLFVEKYSNKNQIVYRLLCLFEKWSCKSADIIIATNESYKQIEVNRCGVKVEDIYVVRNGPDLSQMKITEPVQQVRSKAKTILCYIGAINVQDGVDYLLDVLSKIVYQYNYKDICLLVIGDGDYLFRIKELTKQMNLIQYIVFTGLISDRSEICRYLSTADIFVDAAPLSFLNDNSTFIKHMEYMIFQKPVVSFALKESMFSLKDAGVFVEPNDTNEMAKVILDLINDDDRKNRLGNNARDRVKDLSWDKVSKPLIKAYKDLN